MQTLPSKLLSDLYPDATQSEDAAPRPIEPGMDLERVALCGRALDELDPSAFLPEEPSAVLLTDCKPGTVACKPRCCSCCDSRYEICCDGTCAVECRIRCDVCG